MTGHNVRRSATPTVVADARQRRYRAASVPQDDRVMFRGDGMVAMRKPTPSVRKTSPAEGSNISVSSTSSVATTTRSFGSRFLGLPVGNKTAATVLSEGSTASASRSSGFASFRRSASRAHSNNNDTIAVPHGCYRDDLDEDKDKERAGNNAAAGCTVRSELPPLTTSASTTTGNYSASSKAAVHPMAFPHPSNPAESNGMMRPRGLVGLQNLGNTCFMNSCLQCVSNVPRVMQYFHSSAHLKDVNDASRTKGALAIAFGDLLKTLWSEAAYSSTRPVELKRVLGRVEARFAGYEQQDAQEFLRFLLDGLHEELNRIQKKPPYYEIKDRDNALDRDVSDEYWRFYSERNQSALSDIFCGQLRSETLCHTCKHRSLCFDVFWDLSLPVPKKQKSPMRLASVFSSSPKDDSDLPLRGVSIHDCLKAYTDQEFLSESDSYYCTKCKAHRAVAKRIALYRLPPVLVLHLKRFSYSTFSRDKVTTAIRFPAESLDLAEYCAADAVLDGSTMYDLTGVVNHVGGLNGGHYTAECMNAETKEWYDFNDASVSFIKQPQVCSSSAYILFFQRRAEKSLSI